MKEERMFILNMLNDGKLSADEACKLLAALKDFPGEGVSAEIGEKVNKCAGAVKEKVKKIAKEAEPAVKKYADKVSDKIDDIKTGIKNKKVAENAEDEDIIVDNTQKTEEAAPVTVEPEKE